MVASGAARVEPKSLAMSIAGPHIGAVALDSLGTLQGMTTTFITNTGAPIPFATYQLANPQGACEAAPLGPTCPSLCAWGLPPSSACLLLPAFHFLSCCSKACGSENHQNFSEACPTNPT